MSFINNKKFYHFNQEFGSLGVMPNTSFSKLFIGVKSELEDESLVGLLGLTDVI